MPWEFELGWMPAWGFGSVKTTAWGFEPGWMPAWEFGSTKTVFEFVPMKTAAWEFALVCLAAVQRPAAVEKLGWEHSVVAGRKLVAAVGECKPAAAVAGRKPVVVAAECKSVVAVAADSTS